MTTREDSCKSDPLPLPKREAQVLFDLVPVLGLTEVRKLINVPDHIRAAIEKAGDFYQVLAFRDRVSEEFEKLVGS